jgi:nucleotide-binding universal stress UspA family protein
VRPAASDISQLVPGVDRCHDYAVPSPTTIVCTVDGSRRAHHVARVSRQLAEAADGRVVLTHVFDPMMVPAPPTRELDLALSTEDIERHERRLAGHALARTAESLGDVAYAAVFAEGRPEPEILGVVDDYDARLLVTGSAALTPEHGAHARRGAWRAWPARGCGIRA